MFYYKGRLNDDWHKIKAIIDNLITIEDEFVTIRGEVGAIIVYFVAVGMV